MVVSFDPWSWFDIPRENLVRGYYIGGSSFFIIVNLYEHSMGCSGRISGNERDSSKYLPNPENSRSAASGTLIERNKNMRMGSAFGGNSLKLDVGACNRKREKVACTVIFTFLFNQMGLISGSKTDKQ